MKKGEKNILLCVLAVISIIISLYFDNYLISKVSLLRNVILDNFFLFVTFISSEIIIFFILSAIFLWREHKRRWIFPLWVSLGLSVLVSFILKISIQRLRPFQLGLVSLLPNLESASYSIWNFSFPSFQSMLVFCAIPILVKQFPKLKKSWIIFAILVAFSRVYFGLHFVSDVLTGGFIGYLIGMIVVKLEEDNEFGRNLYNNIFR